MSTEDRKIQLGVVVNSTSAEQGFERVKQGARDMANGVVQAGRSAAAGVDAVGSGGEKAAAAVDRSTRSLIASIQRTTAAMQAGSQSSADYFRSLAEQRGANPEALAPYLRQLEDATRRQQDMAKTAGVSAAQTTAALRMIPAQMTDVVTSLASGQSALTVLVQQGGQIKDSFGGVGAAARAVGGYVVGLINPFTLAAGAAAALATAYYQGSKEADTYARAIVMTGNAAGATVSQMQAAARAIGEVAGTQAAAADAVAQLATTGQVAGGNLRQFGEVAVRMESQVGQAVSETVKQFAELGKSPVEASLKLNEQTHFLTRALYEQIKALQDQGRAAEAAALAQTAYAEETGRRLKQLGDQAGYIERAVRAATGAFKGMWDAALNLGRPSTIGSQLEDARKQLEDRMQRGPLNDNPAVRASFEKGNEVLRERIRNLEEVVRMERRSATAQADAAALTQAQAEWDKEVGRLSAAHLPRKERERQLEAEIVRIRAEGARLGSAQWEIEARIAAAREKFTDKGAASAVGKAAKAAEKELQDQAKLLADLSGLSASFADEWGRLSTIYAKGGMSLDQLTEAQARLLAQQPAMREAARAQADVAREAARHEEELARLNARQFEERERNLEKLREQVRTQEDRNAVIGLEGVALAEAKRQRDLATIALLEEEAALQELATGGAYSDRLAYLNEEIRLRKRLAQGEYEGGVAQASVDSAKRAAEAAAREMDQVGQALANALMEGGKSAADYLKGLFRNLVLRPTIMGAFNGLAGSAAGALGLVNPAAASSGGAGALSTLGNAASLAGAFGSIGSFMATGFMNTVAGTGLTAGLSAAGTLMGTGTMSGIMSGIGMAAGALGPIALGAAAVYAISKAFGGGGTPHVGAGVTVGADGKVTDVRASGESLNQGVADALAPLQQAVITTLTQVSQAFGTRASYTSFAEFAADNDDPSYGRFTLARNGVRAAQVEPPGGGVRLYDSNSETGFKQFAGDVAVSLRDALMAEVPAWADTMLQALGNAPALDQVQATAQQIAQLQQAFTGLGAALGMTQDQAAALSQAFGSVDTFAAGVQAYVDAVYTDSEKLALGQENVARAFDRLGVAVPGSLAAYRQLVEAQDLSTDAGRAMYASLVQLAPAYAQVRNALDEQTAAAQQAAEALAQQRGQLDQQLMQLLGDTAGLRARELAALDPSLRALQRRIYALQDEQAAAAAAGQVQQQRAGIEQQILQLQGNTAALRERELAVLDPANRELQRMVYALQDQQAAAQAAAQAAQEQAQAQASIGQERERLEQALLQLQGDTTELRRRELAALDPSNRALQQRIYDLEDQQKAAQKAAEAAQALRDAWAGVGRSIAEEIQRIRGLDGIAGKTFAQLQAEFAIGTAAARAGDQQAAASLPDLSRAMLEAAESIARSSADLARIRGATAASLEETLRALQPLGVQVPAFAGGGAHAGGLAIVGEQGRELVSLPPSRIYSAGDTAQLLGAGGAAAGEVQALRQELQQLREDLRVANAQIARNTGRAARVLENAAPDGDAINVRTAS